MSYPKFKNKHKEKALFSPEDYVKYKKFPKNLPKKYILIYDSELLEYIIRKYNPRKIKLYSLLTIYRIKDIGIIKMTGIGSPNAATVLEESIALGGKYFLNIGTAGGLKNQGIFLCTKAVRDEGTSYHYIPQGHFSYPDNNLTKEFGNFLNKNRIIFEEGITWTIDAPYRETKAEVNHYKKMGISTVEMEASALFAVAKIRKVKIASIFVVSDILNKEWYPKFHRFNVKKQLRALIGIGIKFLQGKRTT